MYRKSLEAMSNPAATSTPGNHTTLRYHLPLKPGLFGEEMVYGSGAGNAQKSVEDLVLTESKIATEVDMGHIKGHRSHLKRLSMASFEFQ